MLKFFRVLSFKKLLINSNRLLNFNTPLFRLSSITNRMPNYLKNISFLTLILDFTKKFSVFLFYIWDWITLFLLIMCIILSLIVLYDEKLLSLFSNLGLLSSMGTYMATILNIETEPEPLSWYQFFYTSLKFSLNSSYYMLYFFFLITLLYPYQIFSSFFSYFKQLFFFASITCLYVFFSYCFSIWTSIMETASILYTFIPNLPNFFYIFIASLHNGLLIPLQNFIELNQPLAFLDFIPSERIIIRHIINISNLTNHIIINYGTSLIESIVDNIPSYTPRIIISIFLTPSYVIFLSSSRLLQSLVSWLTRWS